MNPGGDLDKESQPFALTLNMRADKDAQAHRSNQTHIEEDDENEGVEEVK